MTEHSSRDSRFFFTSMARISDLPETPFSVQETPRDEWEMGDYVAVEILGTSSGQRIELTSGRMIEVAEGDLAIGALGTRHATLEATGTWKEVGSDGHLSFLTGAGLLGKCTSRSTLVPTLTSAVYRGHVVREGQKRRMADYVTEVPDARYRLPTVLIVGTSMSAGKTTAACIATRLLKRSGRTVVGAKITGAGRFRDVLSLWDAGADHIFDFVDAGLPSTVCEEEEYRGALRKLMAMMADTGGDVAVVEVGASPLEPYNGATAIEHLREHVRYTVLCASDPYAVVGVMSAYDSEPDLVTGVATNTRAGIELIQKLAGVPALNVLEKSARPTFRSRLEESLAD